MQVLRNIIRKPDIYDKSVLARYDVEKDYIFNVRHYTTRQVHKDHYFRKQFIKNWIESSLYPKKTLAWLDNPTFTKPFLLQMNHRHIPKDIYANIIEHIYPRTHGKYVFTGESRRSAFSNWGLFFRGFIARPTNFCVVDGHTQDPIPVKNFLYYRCADQYLITDSTARIHSISEDPVTLHRYVPYSFDSHGLSSNLKFQENLERRKRFTADSPKQFDFLDNSILTSYSMFPKSDVHIDHFQHEMNMALFSQNFDVSIGINPDYRPPCFTYAEESGRLNKVMIHPYDMDYMIRDFTAKISALSVFDIDVDRQKLKKVKLRNAQAIKRWMEREKY